MADKRVTLVISDLHIGDGKSGDDFVYDKNQFEKFLARQSATAEGQKGEIELIINGDFLEFVQVNPKAFTFTDKRYWCSETESLAKLDSILRGHPEIFAALRKFQSPEGGSNRVTLFAGNHDIDLYWCEVRKALRAAAGEGLNIELKQPSFQRYDGRLWISHGHLFSKIDPVNGFAHWDEPRLWITNNQPQRLEMCPGTLFVVKFVNLLEAQYPFADNLHPETALANILWRENKWGLKAVAWLLTRFGLQYPSEILGVGQTVPDLGATVRDAIRFDSDVREAVAKLFRDVLKQPEMTADKVRATLNTDDALADFIEQLMASGARWDSWITVLNQTQPATLGVGDTGGGTLAIRRAGAIDVREECINQARNFWNARAQIVVLGHTHLPQQHFESEKRYYNPGSWTRYIEADKVGELTLAQLENEQAYPYLLHCVRIENTGADQLKSEFLLIDPDTGDTSAQTAFRTP